ncbi:aspartic proteinase nepenthesin-2-like [Chenopodium quinoa]|uniref:aspartic proteinase nepenthesin-2-like n=1 Tax=Chenopodium quinoa TaxID=63459 RepID=UPI000B78A95E|nr:aspartic proteinase nepenthesin-2-like [Chenopodium quinoa]
MLLRFGDDCIQPGKPSATPMFQHQNRPYYYFDLRGIEVNRKDLEIPPNAFQITPDGKGGTIIDTGTTISLVTTSAYQALEKEVAAYIESRNSNVEKLDCPSARYEGFGLCYKRVREPTTFNLPWITWKFANNVIFVMNSDVTFEIYTKHDGQVLVCLMIFENSMEDGDGMTVSGSTQQVGHRITYDIPNGKLLVANEDCNKGR